MDLTKVDAAMEEQMATGKQTQGSVDTANTGGGGGDWANSRGADFDDAAPSGFGDLEDAGVTYSAPEPGAEAESPTPMGRTMSAKEVLPYMVDDPVDTRLAVEDGGEAEEGVRALLAQKPQEQVARPVLTGSPIVPWATSAQESSVGSTVVPCEWAPASQDEEQQLNRPWSKSARLS
eukprot:gnl/MRDRNA2_/MRDRNA2_38964_c0_seq1.p1 gnl/MRDRNA2_/MRDRNA2_38964_c0~~gnl/MRDRNA2_/MRDRNA2_38964_c0_seq1.p1  ORF type:complete len:190 (+),score=54.83 gnl/MRDRNA2_/MRDRNA2_38964_c0_seq1:41-571(+)